MSLFSSASRDDQSSQWRVSAPGAVFSDESGTLAALLSGGGVFDVAGAPAAYVLDNYRWDSSQFGPGATVTWSIATVLNYTNQSTVFAGYAAYSALWPEAWESLVQTAINAWAVACNVTFTRVADPATLAADGSNMPNIRFGVGSSDGAGGNLASMTPFTLDGAPLDILRAARIAFDPQTFNDTSVIYMAIVHEIGHALGLSHSTDPSDVMYANPTGSNIQGIVRAGDAAGVRALYGAWDDHGDSASTATLLNVGNQVGGEITSMGDLDWFRVQLTGGELYRMIQVTTGNGTDPLENARLELRSSTGALLHTFEDNTLTQVGGFLDARGLFIPGASGTFYLVAGGTVTGRYNISFQKLLPIGGDPTDDIVSSGVTTTTYANAHYLMGGAGNDVLMAAAGPNVYDGGAGWDILSYANFTSGNGITIDMGTAPLSTGFIEISVTNEGDLGFGRDHSFRDIEGIIGSISTDVIIGTTGSQYLLGGGNNDQLRGLAGNDTLGGGENGADVVDGGADFDIATYFDFASGGVTVSLAFLGVSQAVRLGSNHTLISIEGLIGSNFADTLTGNAIANWLDGGAGADTLAGGLGDDVYFLDVAGDTVIEAADGGVDLVNASFSYMLLTNFENLTLTGSSAINGTGNAGSNTLTGNGAANVLDGAKGNDFLSGGAGSDTLIGGIGADQLNGGTGIDTLTGGAGNDTFIFNAALSNANRDIITDYNVAADTIRLENAVFTALGTVGVLAATKFFIGSAAHDADDRVVYNATTGALLYDWNGSASGGVVTIATLSSGLALTNADFVVI